MPKKKKSQRFDPNPELKDLPKTRAELDAMFERDSYCQQMQTELEKLRKSIDDTQALLIENETRLRALSDATEKLKASNEMLRMDRDAVIHVLKVVLTDQRIKENPHVRD